MSNEFIALSHCLIANRYPQTRIAFHAGHYYSVEEFYAAVRFWSRELQAEPFVRYALYTEDAYPFTVLFFALLHAGKQVWIASNNLPSTAKQLQHYDCELIGDWYSSKACKYTNLAIESGDLQLSPLDCAEAHVVIFTSGSTGEPKPIAKTLLQLQLEIATLEKQWGKQLGCTEVLATVSHQHIYGLLFRILWPLSAGRCFHSQIYITPEIMLNAVKDTKAYWVASPAHLKRLDKNSPWEGIAALTSIFSSGSALQQMASHEIYTRSGQQVIEIYGSSETGGIAWRQFDIPWQLFEGMCLSCTNDGWQLHSPYLQSHPAGKESQLFQLDDHISLQDDGRFILHGRLDRIVKIEEKRLSLSELEQRLTDTPWVKDAFTLSMAKGRDVIGATIVLTDAGLEQLKTVGRNAFISHTRALLLKWFDAVVLPRKWLLLDSIPLTAQGKIDQQLLIMLLDTDNKKLPQVQGGSISSDTVIELTLRAPDSLIYFPCHFPGYPILPGVVQIAWAEYFGKVFFVIEQPFLTMEVIKFVKIIQPGDVLKLTLEWKCLTGKLYFNFCSEHGEHSSGRLIYGARKCT